MLYINFALLFSFHFVLYRFWEELEFRIDLYQSAQARLTSGGVSTTLNDERSGIIDTLQILKKFRAVLFATLPPAYLFLFYDYIQEYGRSHFTGSLLLIFFIICIYDFMQSLGWMMGGASGFEDEDLNGS